jgi:hypothetical protein
MNYLQSLLILILLGGSSLCYAEASTQLWLDLPTGAQQETVMQENDEFEAQTSLGLLQIHAGAENLRTYTWDQASCQRSAELWPRSSRWNGSYGLYFPGPGNHWRDCKGISRGVLEEGQLHFATTAKAVLWLQNEKIRCSNSGLISCEQLHSADGLFLQFGMIPSRHQLNVRLFQILIHGEKPNGLPASSSNIQLK